MSELLRRLQELWPPRGESLVQVVDILLVAFIIYRLLLLVRSTRAWRILVGIVVFIVALVLADVFQLNTLHWILEKATLLAPVALVILFLPELRHMLEGFGKLGDIGESSFAKSSASNRQTVEEILAAVVELAATRTGALIVIERAVHLDDVVATGVLLNAQVTAPLLGSIFYDQNPLHDGAAVIRGNTIAAAACRLPLSDSRIDAQMHMRHRAGLGISEQSDSITLIVSEERGYISLAFDGRVTRYVDHNQVREALMKLLYGDPKPTRKKNGRSKKPSEVA